MQTPLQITYRNLPRSDALDERIRHNAASLEEFHPRIMSCRVVVEQLGEHHHQGNQYRVHIDARVPGHDIVIDRDHDQDVYVAVRDAFNAAARRLEEAVRVDRGDVKVHAPVVEGRIAKLFPEEGYGFIETAEGDELYFSRENVVEDFNALEVDTPVHFIEEAAGEGMQAKRVALASHRP